MTSFRLTGICIGLVASQAVCSPTYATLRQWNPSTNIMFGTVYFSNPLRWIPNGSAASGDDLQFISGVNGSAGAVVDVASSRTILVTEELSVNLALANDYLLSSSLSVGAGGSSDDSRLTLQNRKLTTPTVNVGAAGASNATAALAIGGSPSTASSLAATNVFIGGTSSGAAMHGAVEVNYGSLTATSGVTVYPAGTLTVSLLNGTVVIDSASPTTAPTLATSVGWSGTGQLSVQGKFDTPKLYVGRNALSNGTVTISDAPSNDVSLGIVDIASAGMGSLNLTNAVVDTDNVTMGVNGTLSLNTSTLGSVDVDMLLRGQINATAGESKLVGGVELRGPTVTVSMGATLRFGGGLVKTIKYVGGSYTGAGAITHDGSVAIEFTGSTTIAVKSFYVSAATITVPNNVIAQINSRAFTTSDTTDFSGDVVIRGGTWDVSLENNRPWQLFETIEMHRPLSTIPVVRGSSPVTVFGRISSEAAGRIESEIHTKRFSVIQGPTMGAEFLRLTGAVSGIGSYEGNVAFAGVFSPGESAARVTFSRALRLEDSATLTMEIGGLNAGTDYDQLAVTGTAELDGDLAVVLGSFVPAIGNSFSLIEATSIVGTFDSALLPSLPTDRMWQLAYTPTALVLSVASTSILGDFNSNGAVDGDDFLLWQRGLSPHPLSSMDLNDWRSNFGAISSSAFTNHAVPEPTAICLALSVCAMIANKHKRARS